jgi:hypothetical protein
MKESNLWKRRLIIMTKFFTYKEPFGLSTKYLKRLSKIANIRKISNSNLDKNL